ncbi:MAG: PAS domain S-box protein [bacterium]|nr:PAS domain S-box protein [bacterium]
MKRDASYATTGKTARLVWMLAALALGGGVIMLLVVSLTLQGVRAKQTRREAIVKELVSDVQGIGQELSAGEVDILRVLEAQTGPDEDGRWIQRARQALSDMHGVVDAGDAPIDTVPVAEGLRRLEGLWNRCVEWRGRMLAADLQRVAFKQQSYVLLEQLREAVEESEGHHRLNRAILMSEYRRLDGKAADVVGREILQGIGAEADLTAARRELAALDLLCERLHHLEDPRLRPDLQDNMISPTLQRLHRRFAVLQGVPEVDAPRFEGMIGQLEHILFGFPDGKDWEVGDGGLTGAVLDRLALHEQGRALRMEAATEFRAIDAAGYELGGAAKGFGRQVDSTSDQASSRAWVTLLALFAAFSSLFCIGAVRIVRAIRGQVTAIEVANRELADTAAALRDSNEQLQGEIAERERAEAALDREEEHFHLIMQHLSDSVWVVTPDFIVKYVTPSCLDTFGYAPESLVGERSIEYIHPEDIEGALVAFDEVVRKVNPKRPAEMRFRHADGHWVDLEVTATNLVGVAGVDGIVLAARDVTQRKQIEEEQRRLENRIQRGQKMESLSVMAASIAHNFNNLMQAVLAHIDLAQDAGEGVDIEGALSDARSAALRASELSGLMLTYVGQGEDTRESVDLNRIIAKLGDLIQAAVPATSVKRFDLAQDLPAVNGDPSQIEQIVMNLVSNASEAVGGESGTVTIATGTLTCDGTEQGETLLLEEPPSGPCVFLRVSDTGCGMEAETAARIFEPYFTTRFTGRGLGLAVVLGIVRGHNGAIAVESQPGEGTTVTVLFPAVEAAAAPGTIRPAVQSVGWEGGGTVLLADDEGAVLKATSLMLERLGFAVIQAADGQEAVDRFLERIDEVDCAILDMTMPFMDGGEVLQAIHERRADLPAILVSGYDRSRAQDQLDGANWAAFIHKPYSMNALRQALGEALQGQSQGRGS